MTDAGSPAPPLVPLRHADGRPIVGRGLLSRARVIAEGVFASEEGGPAGDRLDWLVLEIEDQLARGGPQIRLTLALGTLAVVLLAPLHVGRLRTLGSLTVAERVHALDAMESGPLASAVLAVKALLCVLWYEHPDSQAEVGFDGRCLLGGGP